jgi:hypothetical protein
MKKTITSILIAALFIFLVTALIISPQWVAALELVRQKIQMQYFSSLFRARAASH